MRFCTPNNITWLYGHCGESAFDFSWSPPVLCGFLPRSNTDKLLVESHAGAPHRPAVCEAQGYSIYRSALLPALWAHALSRSAAPFFRAVCQYGDHQALQHLLQFRKKEINGNTEPIDVTRRQQLTWSVPRIDLYEFNPEQTCKPPYNVRVRTTLPFLGSRFESVRTITISEEVPGVSCRHTLTGFVRVRSILPLLASSPFRL